MAKSQSVADSVRKMMATTPLSWTLVLRVYKMSIFICSLTLSFLSVHSQTHRGVEIALYCSYSSTVLLQTREDALILPVCPV